MTLDLTNLETAFQPIENMLLVGDFGPSYIAFTRSLKKIGIKTYFLAIDSTQPPNVYNSILSGSAWLNSKQLFTAQGISHIAAYANQIKAQAVIGNNDDLLIWLAENRQALAQQAPGLTLLVPENTVLEDILCKLFQNTVAEKVNLPILETTYLSCLDDCKKLHSHQFPICLRPSFRHSIAPNFKARVVHTPPELVELISHFTKFTHPLIAQPFLEAPNLVVHGARTQTGEILAMQSFLVPRKFEGLALSLRRQNDLALVEKQCADFAHLAKLSGAFHFDFLYQHADQKCYFLEVNVRVGGTTDKVYKLGYDEPRYFLKAYGFDVPTDDSTNAQADFLVVNKRAIAKHILHSIKGTVEEFDFPKASRISNVISSVRDLLLAKDSIFDANDLRGTWAYHRRGLPFRPRS